MARETAGSASAAMVCEGAGGQKNTSASSVCCAAAGPGYDRPASASRAGRQWEAEAGYIVPWRPPWLVALRFATAPEGRNSL